MYSLAVISGLVPVSEGSGSGVVVCARIDRENIAETNLRWSWHRDWTSENVVKLRGDQPGRSSNCSWSSPVREREREGFSVRAYRKSWIWSVGPGWYFLCIFISLCYAYLPPTPTVLGDKPCGLVLVLVLLLCILVQWVSPWCIGAEYFRIVQVCMNPCCEASV